MREHLLMAAKSAAWTNKPHFLNRGSDGFATFDVAYDALRIIMQINPVQGAAMLLLAQSDHYYDEQVAIDSMTGIAASLQVPLRLWQVEPQRGLFFVHASIDMERFGCTQICSHHPIPA